MLELGVLVIWCWRNIRHDIVVLFLARKTSRVLNLLATGMNHQNYHVKKQVNQEKSHSNYINRYNRHNCINKDNCGNTCRISSKRKSKIHKPIHYAYKSIHAEETALDKIKLQRSKKTIKASLLVIRLKPASTPESYSLANSRPCLACLYRIKNSANNGLRINKIYYSNDDGKIICYKLKDILSEKQHLSKFYRISVVPKEYVRYFGINSPNVSDSSDSEDSRDED
ncbi:putative cytidine deaminase [Acanthamoeba polyphaga mimivirus]|nr:putative cytidine deaminase [Acanthamoeba polyphaga mimivirus]AKI80855.1 putative cytidine deaminase [Acanthamoeba polyphaga mimivirus]